MHAAVFESGGPGGPGSFLCGLEVTSHCTITGGSGQRQLWSMDPQAQMVAEAESQPMSASLRAHEAEGGGCRVLGQHHKSPPGEASAVLQVSVNAHL